MAALNIPHSDNTVRVRAINALTEMCVATAGFMQPIVPGFDVLNLTSITFVIDHPKLNNRILFDCGARRDFENYSPTIKARLNLNVRGLRIEKDVHEIIEDGGIELGSIESMIWSHWHWDHHGAPEKYPKSVEVVVGPGFKEKFMPGYPTNPEAILLDANFE
jgi:glyoxylase-like metal-dependent hydrolase (beta-lactamase superfamily II)